MHALSNVDSREAHFFVLICDSPLLVSNWFSASFIFFTHDSFVKNVAPPTNQSTFRQWTVGPVFYSALIVVETFGSSNTSQIIDLGANGNNSFTPAYAIYENGQPARLVLLNYITDPSGASTYTATFSIGESALGQSNGTPSQVKVKYAAVCDVVSVWSMFISATQVSRRTFCC